MIANGPSCDQLDVPGTGSISSYPLLVGAVPNADRTTSAEAQAVEAKVAPSAEPVVALDVRTLFHAYHASVWRLLRRFGVHPSRLDDAAQEVFCVAARRLADIQPGKEQSFLYGVALRIASNVARRQRVALPLAEPEALSRLCDERPSPEARLEQREARELLDGILERLPPELLRVFVLFELEGLPVRDIAEIEAIPLGTASSRLRRAREEFSAIARRVRVALGASERRSP